MSLIAQALVTAQEVEDYLQLQTPANDVVIDMLINGVSQQFCTYADRDFISATYTSEKNDGSGKSFQYLKHWPITTLTTVIEDETTLTIVTDFYADLDSGILWKAAGYGYWTTAREGVVVTYTAGYTQATTLPADLKLAALKEVARQYRMFLLKEHGETSRSTDGSSSSYSEKPEWMEVVSRYRRIRV